MASPAAGELEIETLVRVRAGNGEDLGTRGRSLEEEATVAGARAHRLDGEQRAGVAATMPLGGFLR